MRRGLLILGASFLTLTAATAGAAGQQTPDPQEMMRAMEAAMTPGEAHKKLEPLVGDFDVTARMWMDPTQGPTESQGTSEQRWVLGGRFVEARFHGTMMGMPFEGIGFTGYDNVLKKYVGTWIDSMGTGVMTSEGNLKPDGSMEFTAQYPDPVSGNMLHFREVITIQDHDHHSMVMYMKGPDGSEIKQMEIQYTRKK